ncbi:hypothetical protein PG990_001607 [Apiospora arundinis]
MACNKAEGFGSMDSQDNEYPSGGPTSAFLGTRQDQILGVITNAAVAQDGITLDSSQPLPYDPNDQAISQPAAMSSVFTDLWHPNSLSNISLQSFGVDNVDDPLCAADLFNAGVYHNTIPGTWDAATPNERVQELPLHNVADDINQYHWAFVDLTALDVSQDSTWLNATLSAPQFVEVYPSLEYSPLFNDTPSLDASRLASDSLTISDGIAAHQSQSAPLRCAARDSPQIFQVPAVEVEAGCPEVQHEVEERVRTRVVETTMVQHKWQERQLAIEAEGEHRGVASRPTGQPPIDAMDATLAKASPHLLPRHININIIPLAPH